MTSDKWGVAVNNWGDVLCGLGYFQQQTTAQNIIYYGYVNNMTSFLDAQSFITSSRHVRPASSHEMHLVKHMLWQKNDLDQVRDLIVGDTGIDPQDLINTSLDVLSAGPIPIAHHLKLPAECIAWADRIFQSLEPPVFLLQPYSYNSTLPQDHWPNWRDLLEFATSDRNKRFILTGLKWNANQFDEDPNVLNLVDRAPSMCHVYALAQRCHGIITTSNSLAHWAVCQNLPAVVICNKLSSNPDYFFRRILTGDRIQVFNYWSKVIKVNFTLYENFGIWQGKQPVEHRDIQPVPGSMKLTDCR